MSDEVTSPCRLVCRLGQDDRCDGCGRTLAEIARWSRMEPAERERVMRRVEAWTVRGQK